MEYLKRFENKMVEIYYNDEFDKLNVGYIVNEDDEYILVLEISNNGLNDGYSLILKKSINAVSITDYIEDKMILREEYSKIKDFDLFKHTEINANNDNVFMSTLKDTMKKGLICNVVSFDSEEKFFGFIDEVNEDYIIMKYFKNEHFIKIDSIGNVYINAIGHREDYLIYKSKKEKIEI
ncbi:MAG: hypothetical protein KGV54_00660 [Oceanivirga sp.]|nr:hypothetical protein [Oceanivirga sp.]